MIAFTNFYQPRIKIENWQLRKMQWTDFDWKYTVLASSSNKTIKKAPAFK